MKRIFSLIVFVIILHMPTFAYAVSQEEAVKQLEAMAWYTEEYPPYNFADENGVPTGISVDILMAAFNKIGVNLQPEQFKIVPWNRSYRYISKKPKTALFSMTYTSERERIMKIVGPAAPSNVSVFAKKSRGLVVNSVADFIDLTIGVVRDDVGDQLIRKMAVSDKTIKRKNSFKQLQFLLDNDRVDVVAYAASVFKSNVKNNGRNSNEYEEIFVLQNGQVGYAFHQSTAPAVLAPLQRAIDELRADGVIDNIIAKY